jgi:ribosomal protein S18 acetylase RimI-like enzyme
MTDKEVSGAAVRPLAGPLEAAECARMMTSSEPWLTFGRTYEDSLAVLTDPAKEVYVIQDPEGIAGFLLLDMRGVLRGYIQSVCVAANRRGRGIGTALIRWAEARIGRESPNVFMCVSTFNTAARRLYERLGYQRVGLLSDFMVAGHEELLLRKSIGPWASFRSALTRA